LVGIRDFLEVAADHRGRLVVLCDGDGFEALSPGRHINVAANEVHKVSPQQEQLA